MNLWEGNFPEVVCFMTTIEFLWGLRPEHVDTAVCLYDEAFGAKFELAIPSREKRLALFRQSFQPEFAICAVLDGRLVGLAGFHTADGSLTSGIGARELFKQLGWFGGVRATAVFSLYERTLSAGELLMDGIAVDSSCRGAGHWEPTAARNCGVCSAATI